MSILEETIQFMLSYYVDMQLISVKSILQVYNGKVD